MYRLAVSPDCAGDARRAISECGEVDPHESQDHVVRDVGYVESDHVRGIEDLAAMGSLHAQCRSERELTLA